MMLAVPHRAHDNSSTPNIILAFKQQYKRYLARTKHKNAMPVVENIASYMYEHYSERPPRDSR
jgi:hypothetical protein